MEKQFSVWKSNSLWVLLLFFATSAFAQQSTSPWKTDCASDVCVISAEITAEGSTPFKVLVYQVEADVVLEVITPLGIYLQRGVILSIDQQTIYPTKMLSCELEGCRAFTKLDEALLRDLKRGLVLQIIVVTSRTRETLAFDLSLIGFTSAYEGFSSTP